MCNIKEANLHSIKKSPQYELSPPVSIDLITYQMWLHQGIHFVGRFHEFINENITVQGIQLAQEVFIHTLTQSFIQ